MDLRKPICGVILVLLITVAAWAFGFFGSTDPAVARLQELREQMSDQNLSDAKRDGMRDQFRDNMRTLSDEQRRAFFDSNRDQWRGRMGQRMTEFFAMSPVDQRRRLDEMIDRMRQPRAPRPQNAARNDRNDRGAGQSRGNWANMTESQRDARSKRRLDRTSATQRAQMTEFRRRLVERAKERGISDLPSNGRRGGWRGA
jgi:hypothetical protein